MSRTNGQFGVALSAWGQWVFGRGPQAIGDANTGIGILQRADAVVDRLTPFDIAIVSLGLTNDNQGDDALIHALLQVASRFAARHENPNPCRESLQLLEAWKINPHALRILQSYMNTASTRFDAA